MTTMGTFGNKQIENPINFHVYDLGCASRCRHMLNERATTRNMVANVWVKATIFALVFVSTILLVSRECVWYLSCHLMPISVAAENNNSKDRARTTHHYFQVALSGNTTALNENALERVHEAWRDVSCRGAQTAEINDGSTFSTLSAPVTWRACLPIKTHISELNWTVHNSRQLNKTRRPQKSQLLYIYI